jgi:hypothetical protein
VKLPGGKTLVLLLVAVGAGVAFAYYLLPRKIVVDEKWDPALTVGSLVTKGVPGT